MPSLGSTAAAAAAGGTAVGLAPPLCPFLVTRHPIQQQGRQQQQQQ
jgi:hypothetical protein